MAVAVLVALLIALILLRRRLADRLVDLTALSFLKVPVNAVAFRVRRALAFRRGPPEIGNEPKDDLFDHAAPALRADLEARERALVAAYDLGPLRARSTCDVYRDNLWVLDLLDRHVTPALLGALGEAPRVRAVDVGSKDFRYAFALARWLRHAAATSPREVALDGVEVDGHPIYEDGRSRADHAEAFARAVDLAEVRYRVADFLAAPERDLDVVFLFFPFVLRYALVRWGLPLGFFAPERLLAHAARALRPGGLLVIVNHTHEERDRQRALLDAEPALEWLHTDPVESALVDYFADVPERTVTVAQRR